MRQRRGRSPTKYKGSTNAELLDEDDQRELVESLTREASKQTFFFQRVYGYGIGGLAIVFSLVFPLLCQDECRDDRQFSCWSHSFFSAGVHLWNVWPFVFGNALWVPGLDVGLQVFPIGLWWKGFLYDEEHFHLALLLGNFVTFLGARFIRWDMETTEKALQGLDAARYKHKSL